MSFKIKTFDELSVSELYELIRLREQVFVVEQNCPYNECDGYDRGAVHLWSEKEKIIIGYARILPPGLKYSEASFGRVLVSSEYRGKGIAGKLVGKCIEYINDIYGNVNIKISAQSYLTNFYSKFAFSQISQEYLEDNILHVDMLRDIGK